MTNSSDFCTANKVRTNFSTSTAAMLSVPILRNRLSVAVVMSVNAPLIPSAPPSDDNATMSLSFNRFASSHDASCFL